MTTYENIMMALNDHFNDIYYLGVYHSLAMPALFLLFIFTVYFAFMKEWDGAHVNGLPVETKKQETGAVMKVAGETISQIQYIIVNSLKSVGISMILTILFGPVGMLYSTISGGIIMIIVSLIVAFATLGFGLIITWPICIIWGAVSTSSYNKSVLLEMSK